MLNINIIKGNVECEYIYQELNINTKSVDMKRNARGMQGNYKHLCKHPSVTPSKSWTSYISIKECNQEQMLRFPHPTPYFFLQEKEDTGSCLPQPRPPGAQYWAPTLKTISLSHTWCQHTLRRAQWVGFKVYNMQHFYVNFGFLLTHRSDKTRYNPTDSFLIQVKL